MTRYQEGNLASILGYETIATISDGAIEIQVDKEYGFVRIYIDRSYGTVRLTKKEINKLIIALKNSKKFALI